MRRIAVLVACVIVLGVWAVHGAPPASACSCSGDTPGVTYPPPHLVRFTATLASFAVVESGPLPSTERWTFRDVTGASEDVGPRPVVEASVFSRRYANEKKLSANCGHVLAAEPGRAYRVEVYRHDDGTLSTGTFCSSYGTVVDDADPNRSPQPLPGPDEPFVSVERAFWVVLVGAALAAAIVRVRGRSKREQP